MPLLLYKILFGLILPFLACVEIRRGARWPHLKMRFGFYAAAGARPRSNLWLHAASVGEINAALNLVKHLRAQGMPDAPPLVTCVTVNALLLARRVFPSDCCIVLLPYDLPGPIKRFLKYFNPQRLVIVENDFWPLLLYMVHKRGIRTSAVSVALSPAAARRRRWLAGLAYPFWHDLDAVAVQTPQDARQFIQLGVEPARITVCGNLKFDLQPSPAVLREGAALRRRLGAKRRPIWIAASVHPAESAAILDAHAALLRMCPQALLILAPRHLHRTPHIKKILARRQLAYCCFSVLQNVPSSRLSSMQVLLGDTTGDLLKLYAAADLAFVGGSLIAKGGHNPIEPALLARPILMGPYVHKAGTAVIPLRRCGALRIVDGPRPFVQLVPDLMLRSPPELRRLGETARATLQRKSGVAAHLSDVLRRLA